MGISRISVQKTKSQTPKERRRRRRRWWVDWLSWQNWWLCRDTLLSLSSLLLLSQTSMAPDYSTLKSRCFLFLSPQFASISVLYMNFLAPMCWFLQYKRRVSQPKGALQVSASSSKKILIMGGTRFIGIFLSRLLVKEGHQVLLILLISKFQTLPFSFRIACFDSERLLRILNGCSFIMRFLQCELYIRLECFSCNNLQLSFQVSNFFEFHSFIMRFL